MQHVIRVLMCHAHLVCFWYFATILCHRSSIRPSQWPKCIANWSTNTQIIKRKVGAGWHFQALVKTRPIEPWLASPIFSICLWQQIKMTALLQSRVTMHSFGVTWLTRCMLGSNFVFWGSCLAVWGLVSNPKCRQQIYERITRCIIPKYGMMRIFVSYNQDQWVHPETLHQGVEPGV